MEFLDPRGLFHLVAAGAWRVHLARGGGEWRPESLAEEGFCHLSFGSQVPGTLAAHFAGVDELLLLELDPHALGDDLRLERSRGGAHFPHLYRPLRPTDLVRERRLVRGADGAWRVEP